MQEARRRVLPDPLPALIAASQQRASPTAVAGGATGMVQALAACLRGQLLPKQQEYRAVLCGPVQLFGATLFCSGWG